MQGERGNDPHTNAMSTYESSTSYPPTPCLPRRQPAGYRADAATRQHGWQNARRTQAASSEEQRGDDFASAGDANFGKDVAEYSCVVYGEGPTCCSRGVNP
jgi:hypothetical protein